MFKFFEARLLEKEKTKFATIVNEYRLYREPGTNFYQTPDQTQETVPEQGIKVHISAGGMTDLEHIREYVRLLEIIVPQLREGGACFKVASIELALKWHNDPFSGQRGKLVTIYECAFPARNFFRRNYEELFYKNGDVVKYDKAVGGRVFLRYGAFYGNKVIDLQNGRTYDDIRTQYKPSFVPDISLGDFIEACQEKYEDACFWAYEGPTQKLG